MLLRGLRSIRASAVARSRTTACRFVSSTTTATAATAAPSASSIARPAVWRRVLGAVAVAGGAIVLGSASASAPARAEQGGNRPLSLRFVELLPLAKRRASESHSPEADRLRRELEDGDVSKLIHVFESYSVNGRLSEKQYLAACAHIGLTDPEVVHSFFQSFDTQKHGSVCLVEFVSGLCLLSPSTQNLSSNQKLKMIFNLVDLDKNGRLTIDKIRTVVRSLMQSAERVSGATPQELERQIWSQSPFLKDVPLEQCNTVLANILSQTIFDHADVNRTGVVTFEEFELWVKTNGTDVKYLMSLFDHRSRGMAAANESVGAIKVLSVAGGGTKLRLKLAEPAAPAPPAASAAPTLAVSASARTLTIKKTPSATAIPTTPAASATTIPVRPPAAADTARHASNAGSAAAKPKAAAKSKPKSSPARAAAPAAASTAGRKKSSAAASAADLPLPSVAAARAPPQPPSAQTSLAGMYEKLKQKKMGGGAAATASSAVTLPLPPAVDSLPLPELPLPPIPLPGGGDASAFGDLPLPDLPLPAASATADVFVVVPASHPPPAATAAATAAVAESKAAAPPVQRPRAKLLSVSDQKKAIATAIWAEQSATAAAAAAAPSATSSGPNAAALAAATAAGAAADAESAPKTWRPASKKRRKADDPKRAASTAASTASAPSDGMEEFYSSADPFPASYAPPPPPQRHAADHDGDSPVSPDPHAASHVHAHAHAHAHPHAHAPAAAMAASNDDKCTIFVGNLAEDTPAEALREVFSACGTIVSVQAIASRNYGFVRFAAHESAARAIEELNSCSIHGSNVRVSWSKPKVAHHASGSGEWSAAAVSAAAANDTSGDGVRRGRIPKRRMDDASGAPPPQPPPPPTAAGAPDPLTEASGGRTIVAYDDLF